MPNRIETDLIIRDQENKRQDEVKASNADYVTQLEETSSIMPPEKPFETEAAQSKGQVEEVKDTKPNDDFVQQIRESSNEIENLDKTNETKLYMLNEQHKKISTKLGLQANTKKEIASLETLISEVEQKIETYRSKLKAGTMTAGDVGDLEMLADGEGNEGEGSKGGLLDGVVDADVLLTVPSMIAGKKEEEEEGKEEEEEKEYD